MAERAAPPLLIVELPRAVGFRGQVKAFLAWLGAWPKHGQMVAVLGSGVLAGCLPDGDGEPRD
ncbi:MAG: hypothetical protein ACM3XN_03405 [Chloroflexota bacterium]